MAEAKAGRDKGVGESETSVSLATVAQPTELCSVPEQLCFACGESEVVGGRHIVILPATRETVRPGLVGHWDDSGKTTSDSGLFSSMRRSLPGLH